jgi:tetratricopeptide (TPR) repeat protein
MKAAVTVITLLLFTSAHSQSYSERFEKLFTDKDTLGERTLLLDWQKNNDNDPELYTSYFNYYVQKSMSDVIILGDNPPTRENFQVIDSTDKVAGYIYGEKRYNPKYLDLGFHFIDKGIDKFPNRLDMRFGKIHMLGQARSYDSFTGEIVRSIEYSIHNNNQWLWMKDQPVDKPKDFLLENLQTYVNTLFDQGPIQAKNIRRIAETSLKHYPDHVVSLSNLAVSYLMEDEYKKALDPLLAAEKKSPEDEIILANIAYVYANLKNKKKAIDYYEKVIRFGSNDAKRFAEEKLKDLK